MKFTNRNVKMRPNKTNIMIINIEQLNMYCCCCFLISYEMDILVHTLCKKNNDFIADDYIGYVTAICVDLLHDIHKFAAT